MRFSFLNFGLIIHLFGCSKYIFDCCRKSMLRCRNKKHYALYIKDTHWIWFRSAKFLSKSKSWSGSRSGFYFGFRYQNYILYIEDTHQILFGSDKSFKIYCVLGQDAQTDIRTQTDSRQTDFFCLFWVVRHKKHGHPSKGDFFFNLAITYRFTYYVCDEKIKMTI